MGYNITNLVSIICHWNIFLVTVHQQFKMYATLTVHTAVFDVLGPGFAFNINHNARSRLRKVNKYERRQITFLVGKGEILEFNSILRVVVDWANILLISRVLQLEKRKKVSEC